MSVEIRTPTGQPVTTADRSHAVAESLRQVARVSRFADRKKGIRSYQSHNKSDPVIPILFALCFALPTLLGVIYYGLLASDRYVTEARFALRPALGSTEKASSDQVGTSKGVVSQMVAQDSLVAINYIHSRPMIEVLEKDLPVREMFARDGIDYLSRFNADKPIERFVHYWNERVATKIESGSGIISLTVNAVQGDLFRLTIVPHTAQETTIARWKPGHHVNLEVDQIARYLERLMQGKVHDAATSSLTLEKLAQSGFL